MLKARNFLAWIWAAVVIVTLPDRAFPLPFDAPRSFLVGNVPESVAVGDFNGDGRPDLAIADRRSNAVSVQLTRTT
jgi:hypothetical protein